jgi:hypothetical protein
MSEEEQKQKEQRPQEQEPLDQQSTNESEQPAQGKQQPEEPKQSKPAAKKRKREPTKSLGEFYDWQSADALASHFALPSDDIAAEARAQLTAEADERQVTLDDVLALPANVVNQRQADKLLAIEKKYADAVEAALHSAKRLVATAQVHKVQREAQALKDQLDADRKAAKKQKTK